MPGVRKRPLGSVGREVAEIALGTWGLSGDAYGQVPEAEADRVDADQVVAHLVERTPKEAP